MAQQNEERAERADFWEHQRNECDPQERIVLDLMLVGEHETACYAEALGFQDHAAWEQEREVKRLKDRIKARLRRKVQRGNKPAS